MSSWKHQPNERSHTGFATFGVTVEESGGQLLSEIAFIEFIFAIDFFVQCVLCICYFHFISFLFFVIVIKSRFVIYVYMILTINRYIYTIYVYIYFNHTLPNFWIFLFFRFIFGILMISYMPNKQTNIEKNKPKIPIPKFDWSAFISNYLPKKKKKTIQNTLP